MKIEISMRFERISEDISKEQDVTRTTPHISTKIEMSEEEMNYMKRSHKELFEAITRLLNFTVQFMQ